MGGGKLNRLARISTVTSVGRLCNVCSMSVRTREAGLYMAV
jgi:hypothetical protein